MDVSANQVNTNQSMQDSSRLNYPPKDIYKQNLQVDILKPKQNSIFNSHNEGQVMVQAQQFETTTINFEPKNNDNIRNRDHVVPSSYPFRKRFEEK